MKAEANKTRLAAEVLQLKSQLHESQQKRSTLEENAQLLEERVGTLRKQYEAQEMAKHIRATDLENARREVERQTLEVTALRQELERVHSDGMAKDDAMNELNKSMNDECNRLRGLLDDARRDVSIKTEHAMRDMTTLRQDLDLARSRDRDVKELEKKLEVVGNEHQRREQELQALLNKQSKDVSALAKKLADANGQLAQVTADSDRMRNDMTEVRNSAR